MDYQHIANSIIAMRDSDLQLRDQLIQRGQLGEGYHPAMAALHDHNAMQLNDLMEAIGYPTAAKVGQEASEAAWLIIQHAIGQPAFMRASAQRLAEAVHDEQADPISLAYLTDRIAVLEGKPQLYGTQFDWDENGALSPNPVDDATAVNQRRARLGLNSLEAQTLLMQKRVRDENQSPPQDFAKRKREMDEWRKRVGWAD
ncbi:hypothetical protein QWY85_19525 [Neolewinella lacunae]|uniref:Uncharacterized protein n=1 Tax=Neolewinella lacunae TaxID=1517758 RepID=A0A923PT00_9BACT|nr:DUF6624 domain-containing protein [Neolewinella lacunae]MBC6996247.1 hypothetical protein [Neolewinella lacunae]MDN3636870.1 hypothetical protein [Neolewinella lacunae]